MSVSMMTFSVEDGVDWGEQTGEADKIAKITLKITTVVNLDMHERSRSHGRANEWDKQKLMPKSWCGREDSNLHALRR